MPSTDLDLTHLTGCIRVPKRHHPVGRIVSVSAASVTLSGLAEVARLGDRVHLLGPQKLSADIFEISGDCVSALTDGPANGLRVGQRMRLAEQADLSVDDSWLGRIVDPYGVALDGDPLMAGPVAHPLVTAPPPPATRRALGDRLETGLRVFNTFLPIARGQRLGLFAGSGVGKSTLLGTLCRQVDADVVVIGLVGERGRELRHFIEDVLGPDGMARAVIVAATSDMDAQRRKRCALSAMTVAEHFRDQGRQVLLVIDSITRLAEAHRETATAAGEAANLRGYPPSTAHMLTSLCERAGPGAGEQGDITAIFSVLVAGSDMEEPVADMLRGVLDGHVVLDREIAERGRYPAIDLLRSVSRCLPAAASEEENDLLTRARARLAVYERSEMMVQAGLYSAGTDPSIDEAMATFQDLDAFIAAREEDSLNTSFVALKRLLDLAARKGKLTANHPTPL
ncbi:FliI/YscN family ATPase [Aestuariibius insulae]|uniref:FliI/YscN family ATPase n=1 Tax=Aestuariibius insulae TaxID=2058287 RepID=UPI00345EA50A